MTDKRVSNTRTILAKINALLSSMFWPDWPNGIVKICYRDIVLQRLAQRVFKFVNAPKELNDVINQLYQLHGITIRLADLKARIDELNEEISLAKRIGLQDQIMDLIVEKDKLEAQYYELLKKIICSE